MTVFRRFRWLVVTTVVLAMMAVQTGTGLGATSGAQCGCENVVDAQGHSVQIPHGRQVVLLVHGMLQQPSDWIGPGSLAEHLAATDSGYTLALFDYHTVSTDWVTDPGPSGGPTIAEKLAAAIRCLAARSGLPVSIVAYSMGSFAAQKALEGEASSVAGLIALATPWKGPLAPNIVRHRATPTCVHEPGPSCLPWLIPKTSAAQAMRQPSILSSFAQSIRRVQVVPVAGVSSGTISLFGIRRSVALGDVVMSPESATSPPAEVVVDPAGHAIDKTHPAPTVSCYDMALNLTPPLEAGPLALPIQVSPSSRGNVQECWHGMLLRHPDFVSVAMPALERWRQQAQTTQVVSESGSATGGCSESGASPGAESTEVDANPGAGVDPSKSVQQQQQANAQAKRKQVGPRGSASQKVDRNPSPEVNAAPAPPPPQQQAAPKNADPQRGAPAEPAAPKPYASLDVASGPPGTAIEASGGGFVSNKPITVTESGPVGSRTVGTITAESDGSFTMHIRVSDPTLPGRDTITFAQGSSSVSVHFTITAPAAAAPKAAVPAAPKAAIPAAPSDVHIDQFGSTGLRWNDNSNNERGFHVYQNGRLVATEPANSTQLHGSLVGACSDTLVVGAFNAAGEAKSAPVSYCTAHWITSASSPR